ncbi:hypothetical protein Micbo1qcDRAFT_154911 [Microdochium bolleyi]|uniref:Peroxin 22-like protein n=1 Tax=Microdochium bolleyi TaxID=196109 RepID=A0A136JGR9_9PEZI|nr:hypothetical protein Micbo1qcDRAFT_154911 [Microdochium bolleyi]
MSSDSRSRRRGVWTHWVPLVATVTIATVGLAAWAWSQRSEEEEEEHGAEAGGLDYNTADYGDNPAYGATREKPAGNSRGVPRDGNSSYGVTEPHAESAAAATGWGAQMSGALRRTPSPQQFLSNASRTVAAGMTGIGAAVGSALASIREDDKNAYADHETWSEEVENQRSKPSSSSKDPSKRRKTVAIVVSADANLADLDADDFHEHASVLSHIPKNVDFSKVKLFVLIYSPSLKEAELSGPASTLPPPSLSSSFSNIGNEQVKTPASEGRSPLLSSSNVDASFNAVYAQAQALVEKESMIMPFTTANGYTHILRHLQPSVVYLQESLSGPDGSLITQLQTWLRHDVILVVGADGGHGGLADSESEAERPEKTKEAWWHREDRVGRGRGVVVVDSLRVGDDWARRVQGKE